MQVSAHISPNKIVSIQDVILMLISTMVHVQQAAIMKHVFTITMIALVLAALSRDVIFASDRLLNVCSAMQAQGNITFSLLVLRVVHRGIK